MPREVRAAVCREGEEAWRIETLRLDDPAPGEVVIKVEAAGVCHTDLIAADIFPRPSVLGHEGAGVVVEVGEGVSAVAPGDRVVATFGSCGDCPSCVEHAPAYCWRGNELNFEGARAGKRPGLTTIDGAPIRGSFFQQSSFADHALATERNVVKLPDALAFEHAAPLGCGVQTGAGAIINSLAVTPCQSVAVFGAGAVGLSAVMAAAMIGCETIIAVDVKPNRLALARELGATHALDGRDEDLARTIRDLTGGGVAASLETAGTPATFAAAITSLRPRGACGVVAPPGRWGEPATHPGGVSIMMTRLVGVMEGDSDPGRFIPQLAQWGLEGKLPYERIITTYPFTDINTALSEARRGAAIKPVLTF
ncbi:MAG: NAD(P)-dependent alcohol dehydrogenase [Caulobacterales bacterium]|nr:NAD(P)-dependent alcohol dehydrogenase [Caulobacterales bacterium]